MGIEQQLQDSIFSRQPEKTFIDKVLAKEDVLRLRELIKKPMLERSELLEILYLISGNEAKLLNFDEWDRYLQLKFFVWVREFTKVLEVEYDYEEGLAKQQNLCRNCDFTKDKCRCGNFQPKVILSERCKRLLKNNSSLLQHNAKFLIDLYMNIGRTTMSVGATAFIEMLKNRFEIHYPQLGAQAGGPQEKKKGIFGI